MKVTFELLFSFNICGEIDLSVFIH